MAKRGRKPIPEGIKLVRGNPGKRPVNKTAAAAEANDRGPLPPAPAWLLPEAAAEFRRLAKILERLDVTTATDLGALAAYCQAWARWAAAERFLTENGTVIVCRDDKGNMKWTNPDPHVTIAHKYLAQMRSWAAELGLTPASRITPKATNATPQDAFAQFLTPTTATA